MFSKLKSVYKNAIIKHEKFRHRYPYIYAFDVTTDSLQHFLVAFHFRFDKCFMKNEFSALARQYRSNNTEQRVCTSASQSVSQ